MMESFKEFELIESVNETYSTAQSNSINTVTNGSKTFGNINGWRYYRGRLKLHDLRVVMTNTPYIAFTFLEQMFS